MTMTQTIETCSNYRISRFVTRWLQADQARNEELEKFTQLSFSPETFAQILQNKLNAGASATTSLNAAMRQLRNLVIASLIARDLSGRADFAM